MSRWIKTEVRLERTQRTKEVWTCSLHYRRENGSTHFHKVEVYADYPDECERLITNIMHYLQTEEMVGAFYY